MKIDDFLQKSLILANNSTAVSDAVYKSLLDNTFAVLSGYPEPHNISKLYNSKPDVIKQVYAAILAVTAQFVRTSQRKDAISQFLVEQCSFAPSKTALYGDYYAKNFDEIEASLLNIGTHHPHITDISWKIDYVIKAGNLDASEGPLFRIGLQTEKFDVELSGKKTEFVNFTCTEQELQDLVYKLKDAVRHCQKIGNEHR